MNNAFTTDLQKVQFLDKYARWNPTLGRRETWEETTKRVIDFLCAQAVNKYAESEDVWVTDIFDFEALSNAMLNLDVLPSMRVVQMAGPALERCNVGAYNPVSGDTPVLTREYGLIPIEQLAGKSATVLNVEGRWAEATFTGYGPQAVTECRFRPSKGGNATETVVRATDNHRWVLADGRVVDSNHLNVGDMVKFVRPQRAVDLQSIDYRLGLMHGLIYGDGTAAKSQERTAGYVIRLCSDASELLPVFADCPVTYPPSANGDPVVMLYNDFAKTHSLKTLPAPTESDDYLIGFVRGWMAADGHVNTQGQVVLCGDQNEADWFASVARLGYIVQHTRPCPPVTNFGPRKKNSLTISFFRASFDDVDFIIQRKRAKFVTLETAYYFVGFGKPSTADVYCAHVPDTNTFTLGRGLVTGNCSFLPLKDWRCFSELLYILMQGTGVGFSVEAKHISQLPTIEKQKEFQNIPIYVIEDSTIGWCDAFLAGLVNWSNGHDIAFDYSLIRPYGAPLATKGGKASGPQPLKDLLDFARKLLLNHQGRKLSSLNCHDLACYCGSIVQVGGVRRAAEISLSDVDDQKMRRAKQGQFWDKYPERAMANNSAVYESKPSMSDFMREWTELMNSGTGERGIFNREGANSPLQLPGRRVVCEDFGLNPCGEVILRPFEFCNLSIIVARATDTKEMLWNKAKLATQFGILQSLLTDFQYIRPEWKLNCEDERLLGVDITGQMDHPLLNGSHGPSETQFLYTDLKHIVTGEAYSLSQKLGIPMPAATTCVKPSGNSSQLLNVSSGIHPRYAEYYIRRLRIGASSPVAGLLRDAGVPHHPEVAQDPVNPSVWVFEFPVASPPGARTRHSMDAIRQLEQWRLCKKSYTEHNPSITVYVKEDEWLEVGAWVYRNWEMVGGISFLPFDTGIYQLAPYEECSKDEFDRRTARWPQIDFGSLQYEATDTTELNREFACTGDKCEL